MQRIVTLGILAILGINASHAQPTLPDGALSGFPLELQPTQARCHALGAACTALSMGINSAMRNPASLLDGEQTSFALQYRRSDVDALIYDQDALNSEQRGPRPGQLYKNIEDASNEIAFAGMSFSRNNWAFGLHYENRLSFAGEFAREEVMDPAQGVSYFNDNQLAASLEAYGISLAYQLSPKWSAGISARNATLDIQSTDQWSEISVFNSILTRGANLIDDSSSDWIVSTGILYTYNESLHFGLSYHQGGDFDLSSVAELQGTSATGGIINRSETTVNLLSLPDQLTLGLAWHWRPDWLFSIDLKWHEYSALPSIRGNSLALHIPVVGDIEPIEDELSIHLGMEKTFNREFFNGQASNLSLRAGAFTEPDHDGLSIVQGYDTHFTAGVGLDLGRNKNWTIDFTAEFADEERHYLGALTYRH